MINLHRKANGSKRAVGILFAILVIAAVAVIAVCAKLFQESPNGETEAHVDEIVSESENVSEVETESEAESETETETESETETKDETETETESESEAADKAGTDSSGTTNKNDSATVEKPKPGETGKERIEREAREILAEMTLHEKVCQLFIVTPESLTGVSGTVTASGTTTQTALKKYPVGGIVYFAGNIKTPDQCTKMIKNTQSYSKIGLFIAVDEEGGRVARIGKNSSMGTTTFPSMLSIGQQGTDAAYKAGKTIAKDITAFGFNLDFAPVADVFTNPDNTVIGDRAFSSNAETAAKMVSSSVNGFHDGGILCCIKHFPGHGDTATDSHYGMATTAKTYDELVATEFLPFRSGIKAGTDFVMVGHISTPNVTGNDLPATLSHKMVTDILRGELGFSGIIITDSMSMQAITDYYSPKDAAVKALDAGVDVILMPENLSKAVSGVEDAVSKGTLTEARIDESVLRIIKLKLSSGITTR